MQVICTVFGASMNTVLSEYPLAADHELHMAEEALWVEGVGWLGQYHSYLDALWEKGVPYFVRDYYYNEMQQNLSNGATSKDVSKFVYNIKLLNSKIRAYETMPIMHAFKRQTDSWADEEDKENVPGSADPELWQIPKNPVPIKPTRQNAIGSAQNLDTTNHFNSLEPADDAQASPIASHLAEASLSPSQSVKEPVLPKKPVSRSRSKKPASQP